MAATYTFDVFSTLDGFGSPGGGDWGGYWGKQGPELLDHRLASFAEEQQMIFGGDTYRLFAHFLASIDANPEAGVPGLGRWWGSPARGARKRREKRPAPPNATVRGGGAANA